jgi:hypothetical protein
MLSLREASGKSSLFVGRPIVVATMHGKHHAMENALRQQLGISGVILPEIDTDKFGTFSGEIERKDDPLNTLRAKILNGLESCVETLGIGSEGSFGPHPKIPFIQAHQEIVMLIDTRHGIEIYESLISTDTISFEQEIKSIHDLIGFADQNMFPSHGIILRQIKDGKVISMRKGIVTWDLLYTTALEYTDSSTKLLAQTDLRAHLNPSRMKVIEKATDALMTKINNLCPDCQWPGFSLTEIKPGLPCRECGHQTSLAMTKIFHCKNCSYTDERYYTEGLHAAPQFCDRCNP